MAISLRIEAPCANCSTPLPPETARCPACGAWREPPPPAPFLHRRGAIAALVLAASGLGGGAIYGPLAALGLAGTLWCLHIVAKGRGTARLGRRPARLLAMAAALAGALGVAAAGSAAYGAWIAPKLRQARASEIALSVRSTLRILTAAQMTYADLHPQQGFAPHLADLRAGNESLGLGAPLRVNDDSLRHFGYVFHYFRANRDSYRISAVPISPAAGRLCYSIDQRGILAAGPCPHS